MMLFTGKRTFAAFLAVCIMAGTFAGCSSKGDSSSSSSSVSSSVSSSPASTSGSSSQPSSASGEESSQPDSTAAVPVKDIIDKIVNDEYYGEYGAVTMPAELDEQALKEMMKVDPADAEEFAGAYSMSMTNSDHLIGVLAKEGRVDAVQAALEQRKADLEAQYETYDVNGSYVRAQAAQVYTVGNYVFLIGIGIMPNDPDAPLDFDKDVEHAKELIDEMLK